MMITDKGFTIIALTRFLLTLHYVTFVSKGTFTLNESKCEDEKFRKNSNRFTSIIF